MTDTLEYQTVSHDGVIEIPQEHRKHRNGKQVRVVLMETEQEGHPPGVFFDVAAAANPSFRSRRFF